MVTRSLTEIFILMRNNSLQNNQFISEDNYDVKAHLIGGSTKVDLDFEEDKVEKLPPEWLDHIENIKYQLSSVPHKLKELNSLQKHHLHMPSLDDSLQSDEKIESLVQQITKMLQNCHHTLRTIGVRGENADERKLCENVTASLVRELQDYTSTFRRTQSEYLKQLERRHDTSGAQFESEEQKPDFPAEQYNIDAGQWSSKTQQLLLEENTEMVRLREKEIVQIVRSIQDLNDIFKDVALMVHDQGTILDQIDYNVEQASTRIEEGFKQLQKAEKHHKKNRKMHIILCLAVTVILLLIILVFVKLSQLNVFLEKSTNRNRSLRNFHNIRAPT